MNLQQMTFLDEQDLNQSPVFRGGSRASRTALQESVRHLVTNVIYGRKCGELLAKLNHDGSWAKMLGDCYQARMDGSFLEFSGTLMKWGTMLDGELRALPQLEPSIDESGWRLLPTPTAFDANAIEKYKRNGSSLMNNHALTLTQACYQYSGLKIHPEFIEAMMGYPIGWTDIGCSETQSCPSSSTQSSGQ